MKYRRSEIAVGLFVMAGVGVILYGTFVIRGRFFGATVMHHVVYANVSSLEAGTPVKYSGLLVGRVREIRIDDDDPNRIRVILRVARGLPITTDTIAKITRSDLLGDEYVDLRPRGERLGTAAALTTTGRLLEPGEPIAAGEPFDLQQALEEIRETVARTNDVIATVQGEAEAAIKTVNRILAKGEALVSEENQTLVRQALEDLAATSRRVSALVEDNSASIDAIVANADSSTASLSSVASDVDAAVDRLLPEIQAFTIDARRAVAALSGAAAKADDTLGSLDVQQVNDLLENLDLASRNLAEFTREIRERPYRLIRKEKPAPKEFE